MDGSKESYMEYPCFPEATFGNPKQLLGYFALGVHAIHVADKPFDYFSSISLIYSMPSKLISKPICFNFSLGQLEKSFMVMFNMGLHPFNFLQAMPSFSGVSTKARCATAPFGAGIHRCPGAETSPWAGFGQPLFLQAIHNLAPELKIEELNKSMTVIN